MLFPSEPWEKGRAARMRYSWQRGSSSKHRQHQPCAELRRDTGKLAPFVSPRSELLNCTSAFRLTRRKVNKIRAAQKESGR